MIFRLTRGALKVNPLLAVPTDIGRLLANVNSATFTSALVRMRTCLFSCGAAVCPHADQNRTIASGATQDNIDKSMNHPV